jgi:hypothetical protein
MIGFAVALVLIVVSTYLSGWIAKRRGRSAKRWYWLGALLAPITPIVVALLRRR